MRTRGVDGGYQLAAGASLPPLVVDDEEAVALAVGLRTAAQSGIAGIEEASVRALAKVVQVMPPRLRRRVDALRIGHRRRRPAARARPSTPGCSPPSRRPAATRSGSSSPTSPATASAPTRRVEPHRLVSVGRRWYLVAYDLTRFDWRSFRLDRLAEPRPTGTRVPSARRCPPRTRPTFVRDSLGGIAPSPLDVVAIVSTLRSTDVEATIGQWATVEDDGRRARHAHPDDRGQRRVGAVRPGGAVDAPVSEIGRSRRRSRRGGCTTGASGSPALRPQLANRRAAPAASAPASAT